jgi:tRNA-Thr(GGU) m(6)t(6)A37 methyltransferase TsaA
MEGMPIQPLGAPSAVGRIELEPQFVPGLQDLDGFSHLILIYHFHRAGSAKLTVKPFLDEFTHGVFATRAPVRPNPIGLSIVELIRIEANLLEVLGVDMLDGTPLLDIKPYVPAFDTPKDPRCGWLDSVQEHGREQRSDRRFT